LEFLLTGRGLYFHCFYFLKLLKDLNGIYINQKSDEMNVKMSMYLSLGKLEYLLVLQCGVWCTIRELLKTKCSTCDKKAKHWDIVKYAKNTEKLELYKCCGNKDCECSESYGFPENLVDVIRVVWWIEEKIGMSKGKNALNETIIPVENVEKWYQNSIAII